MMERVFDFGDAIEKIFPARPQIKTVSGDTRRPSIIVTDTNVSTYSSFDSLSEDQEDDHEEDVILAGRNLSSIPDPTSNVSSVRLLDLSYNSLTKLAGIHMYVRLEELILDNNRLTLLALPPMIHLKSLSLNNNNLQDLFRVLRNLEISVPQLTYLSLLCNPVCPNELMSGDEDDYQMYRYAVINRLKSLKFLDSRPVTLRERADANRFTSFTGVVRATEANYNVTSTISYKGTPLKAATPLKPNQKRVCVAGKLKRKYVGDSEGNRFIENDQL